MIFSFACRSKYELELTKKDFDRLCNNCDKEYNITEEYINSNGILDVYVIKSNNTYSLSFINRLR